MQRVKCLAKIKGVPLNIKSSQKFKLIAKNE